MTNELLYVSPQIIEWDEMGIHTDEIYKALTILKWQLLPGQILKYSSMDTATYYIFTYKDYCTCLNLDELKPRTINCRYYIIFKDEEEFNQAMKSLRPNKKYIWKRLYSDNDPGYEVTSRGDRRYSPFFMRWELTNGKVISLEDYWKEFIKPLPPEKKIGTAHDIFGKYLNKYKGLFYELAVIGLDRNLTDMFDVNGGQNLTYCDLLNSYFKLE